MAQRQTKKQVGIPYPEYVKRAVRSGELPPMRTDDQISAAIRNGEYVSRGEKVIMFAHAFLRVPEGIDVGKPLRLSVFQRAFIICTLDNPHGTRKAILSVARRNGKTALIGVILLAFLIGPLAVQNSLLASGAMSREQAALVFKLMVKMLSLSPELEGLYRIVPSSKRIIGLPMNVEFEALSADAKTGHGRSLLVVILDEAGQIVGPHSEYVGMLESSQGSYTDPLFITISTQAPSDADLLSVWIDDASRTKDIHTVCHVYEAPANCALMDKNAWHAANPGLNEFRSEGDLSSQLDRATRLPASEASVRNLLLNQRVSREGLWLAPSVWRANSDEPDLTVFRTTMVSMGLDLSSRNDFTAAVISARDSADQIHMIPFVFTPSQGLEERARQNRAPLDLWVREGKLIAVEGPTITYDWVCEYLQRALAELEIDVDMIAFDRWKIRDFRLAAERTEAFQMASWHEVGQGFRDQSPRLQAFESDLLEGRIKHGGHPLLNWAASSAIVVKDPAGNIKIDKSRVSGGGKIDALVAAVMSAYPVSSGRESEFNVASFIV